VSIAADTSNLITGVETANAKLDTISGTAMKMAGIFGVAFSAEALIGFGRAIADDADLLTKLHDKTGLTTDALQRFRVAGDDAGNSVDELASAVTKMQKNVAGGNGSAVSALKELNIGFDDFRALGPEQQFYEISDAIQKVRDPAEQAKLAIALFGKTGAEILPTLKRGFDDVRDSAVGMSADTVQALDEAGDMMKRWSTAAKGYAAEWLVSVANDIKSVGIPALREYQANQKLIVDLQKQLNDQAAKMPPPKSFQAPAMSFPMPSEEEQKRFNAGIDESIKKQQKLRDEAQRAADQWQKANEDLQALVAGQNWDGSIEGALRLGVSVSTLATWFGVATGEIERAKREMELFQRVSADAAEQSTADWKKWVEEQQKAHDAAEAAFMKNNDVMVESSRRMYDAMSRSSMTSFDYQRRQVTQWQDMAEGAIDYTEENWIDAYQQIQQEATERMREINEASEMYASTAGMAWQGPLQQISKFGSEIDAIVGSFSEMARASNSAWASVVLDIGQAVAAMQKARQSGAGNNVAQGGSWGNVAIAGAGAAGGMLESDASDYQGTTRGKVEGAAGGALSGAATGAMIGSIIPGIGTAIGAGVGAIVGAIKGWIQNSGPTKEEKEGRKIEGDFEGQFGGFNNMLKSVGQSYAFAGRSAEEAQVAVKAMMDAEKQGPEATKAWRDEIQAVIALQQKAVQALPGILADVSSGMNSITAGTVGVWNGTVDKLIAGGDKTKAELGRELKDIGNNGQEQFDRIGRLATTAFAAATAGGQSFLQALQGIGPSLQSLQKAQQTFGFTSSQTLTELMKFSKFADENKEVVASLDGVNKMMSGLQKMGKLTQENFDDLSSVAEDAFNKMIAGGLDGDSALRAMQPTLQMIWQLQKDYGYQVDDSTQKMLDQAEQAGIVGEQMKGVQEQTLDVLKAIAKVLGADIPNALNQIPSKKTVSVDVQYNDPGKYDGKLENTAIPEAAGDWGMVDRPTLFLAGEAGPEEVAFSGAGKRLTSAGGGGADGISRRQADTLIDEFKALRRHLQTQFVRDVARLR
jgi:hypothetical protein